MNQRALLPILAGALTLAAAAWAGQEPPSPAGPQPKAEGRVVDSQDRPVSDAEVRFSLEPESDAFLQLPPEEARRVHSVRSDARGMFHVDDLKPGARYDVVVVRRGYAAFLTSFSPPAAGPSPELRLVLKRGKTARGLVLDRDGRPVVGAEVRIERSPWEGISVTHPNNKVWADHGLYRARTGPDGRFEVTDLPEHAFDLDIRGSGFAPFSQSGFRISGPREVIDLGSFRLKPGAIVEGIVVDPRGKPIPGAAVWLDTEAEAPIAESGPDGGVAPQELAGATILAMSRESALLWTTTVDPEGRYRLRGLFPGEWDVAVSTSLRDRHERLVLAADEEERELDIVLPEFFEVRGRVTGPEDEPIARAWVRFSRTAGDGAVVPTEADGSFSAFLDTGTYQIEAEGHEAGYLEAVAPPLELRGPVDGIEIRLSRGATLRGRVTGLELDDPRSVFIEARNGSLRQSGRLTRDGVYRLTGLAPGAWEVEARHLMDKVRADVRIAPGSREALLDLAFTPGTLTLSGTIEGAAGLPSLAVLLKRMEDEGETSAWVDSEGSFRFTRLHPGRYKLTVYGDSGIVSVTKMIEMSADREVVVKP